LDRLDAYRQTMQAHGLQCDGLVFRVPAHRLDGAQLMRKMMSLSSPPTAVYIADPLTAEGAIHEAHKLGVRIPDELSILGFDDTDMRHSVFPTMTAVCQDSRELGRLAYDLLLRRAELQTVTLEKDGLGKAWLEINHTVGRAPDKPIRILSSGERLAVAI
jgi:DNA-binding LacI/PurR family transcriptional regulator